MSKKIGRCVNRFGLFVLCVALVATCALVGGCSRASSNGGTASHSAEYYEGVWCCSGYSVGGELVSYDSLSSDQKATYPYMTLELAADHSGSLTRIQNGSGDPETLLMGEWSVTNDGVKVDGCSLGVDGDSLTYKKDGSVLYFQKCVSSGGSLNVDTFQYEGISFDAPVELAYFHDAVSEGSSNYGIASSYRVHAPSLLVSASPTDVADVSEMSYFAGHEDSFTNYNGITYFVDYDEESHSSFVSFVADGKWYQIDFSFYPDDYVDFSNYAETFYTAIRLDGASDSVGPDAVSWQEASDHVGEMITVCGPVASTEYASSSNGRPTFIDLGASYPSSDRVSLVVWGEDRDAFPEPPESLYKGKTLYVTGEVYLYEGVCMIKVVSPSQISVA